MSRRFAFSLCPIDAVALLRVVDDALKVVVHRGDVPLPERHALGRVQKALRTITESPDFLMQQLTRPAPRTRKPQASAKATR